MLPPRFLDTNVLLRYFTRDNEELAQRALALLRRVENGEERVEVSLIVVFEVVFTLERYYKMPRVRIFGLFEPVLSLRGLRLPGKPLVLDALDRYAVASRQVSFADIYNALYAQSQGMTEIYSWDKDFDAIEGITRVEPGDGDA